MKKNLIVVISLFAVLLMLASCSQDPKEQMIGRWVSDPESSVSDVPIEIEPTDSANILGTKLEITYGKFKDGEQKGKLSSPMGAVDFSYYPADDKFEINLMGNTSSYMRFEGTDEEWGAAIEDALKRQKLALVQMNMYTVQSVMEQIYSEKNYYPNSMDKVKENLPGNIQNPLSPGTKAIDGGYQTPEFDPAKQGMVYIKFSKDRQSYEVYGYGLEQMILPETLENIPGM